MDEQGPRGRLEPTAAVEERARGLEQRPAGGDQRAVDPVDQQPPGVLVAGEDPLGEQVVGQDRAGRVRPGRRGQQPGQRRPRRAAGGEQVGHRRPDHDRALAEVLGQRLRRPAGVLHAAEDGQQPSSLHGGQGLDLQPGGAPAEGVDDAGRSCPAGVDPATTATWLTVPQPRARGPGLHRVVGLAAQDGVDDQGLEPRVPRAAGLGGLGVDLRRRRRRSRASSAAPPRAAPAPRRARRGARPRPRPRRRRCGPGRGSGRG